MSWLDQLLKGPRDTGLVRGLQAGLQQFGQNRQQGIPLMQGHKTGNGSATSVVNAMRNAGGSQAYAPTNPVGPMSVQNQSFAQAGFNPTGGSGGGGGYSGGGGGNTGGGGMGGGSQDMGQEDSRNMWLEHLMNQRNERMRQLQSARDAGLGYLSDARNTLGKKRDQFSGLFDEGRQGILENYEGGRADLQAANRGADARTARGLTSRGYGGSTLNEALRGNEMARQSNLGNMIDTRQGNERENQRTLDSRIDWADAQEAELGRSERGINDAYMAGTRTSALDEQGSLLGLIQQAQSHQQSIAAARAAANNYQADPFQVQGFGPQFVQGLNQQFGELNGQFLPGGGGQDQQINPAMDNLSLMELERRRKGLLA